MFESIHQAASRFASPAGAFSLVLAALLGIVVADGQMGQGPAGERKTVASEPSGQVLQDGSDWLSEGYWARKRANRLRQQYGRLAPETNPFDGRDPERRRSPAAAAYQSDSGLYRTVCVRLCDGYYFPISFSTTRDRFGEDEKLCRSRCSGDVRLFYHSSGAPEAGTLKDLEGRGYTDLDNAFVYRTRYQPSCQCRPEPWSEAARQRHAMYATEAWQENARRLAKAEERGARRTASTGGRSRIETAALRETADDDELQVPLGAGNVRRLHDSRMSLGRARERGSGAVRSQAVTPRERNWRSQVFNNLAD